MLLTRHALGATTLLSAVLGTALAAQDLDVIYVTNPNDSGDGSLRAALVQAATESKQIVVATDEDIWLDSGLVYDNAFPLHLTGSGQTIRLRENETILSVKNGLGLHVSGLNFRGRGGYSIERRGDLNGPAGKGIFFGLSPDNISLSNISLTNVTVRGAAGHGVHISDCDLGDDCGAGGDQDGHGSDGSIRVTLLNVTIENVGRGSFDADGLRVDERGPGDIELIATNLDVRDVGADGIELDEGDEGRVQVHLTRASLRDNGSYCDPALLGAFLPSTLYAEFDVGEMTLDAIMEPISEAPDNRCIEGDVVLHDDGSVAEYDFEIDLDDGFDIDETGDGDIRAFISEIDVMENTNQGLDFDEAGPGDLRLNMIQGRFSQNTDDGVKLTEEGDGDVQADVSRSFAFANGGNGFVFEEADGGDLRVTVVRSETNGNDDRDDTGIEAVQEGDGTGEIYVIYGSIVDGIDLDGVTRVGDE